MVSRTLGSQESLRGNDIDDAIHEECHGRRDLLLGEASYIASNDGHDDCIVDPRARDDDAACETTTLIVRLRRSDVQDYNTD